MRIWLCALLLVTVTSVGCHRQPILSSESQSLTPASAAIVEDGVRGFMQAVAHDSYRGWSRGVAQTVRR